MSVSDQHPRLEQLAKSIDPEANIAEVPTLYSQLETLESMCMAEWIDPETGRLPKGWWPVSFEVGYGDAGSSSYSVEFSGFRNWNSRSYTVSLSGYQWAEGSMSNIKATHLSVKDTGTPEVIWADEDVQSPPDQAEQILRIYSGALQDILNPDQQGVRIEVRFAKVRKHSDIDAITAEAKLEAQALGKAAIAK